MKEKRCSKCKEVFPCTSEYYYINSDGKVPARCKKCYREDQRERDRKKREKKGIVKPPGKPRTAEVYNEGTQVCSLCKKEFPLTSEYFCVNKAFKTGLTKRCRTCQNAYDREKYAKRKAEGRGRKYIPDSKYAELLKDKFEKDEEAYKKLISEPKNYGIGNKLDTLKFQIGKKYKIERRKNKENDYENLGAWTMAQDCKDHITLRHKRGYSESFRKYGILCGDYKIEEVRK